MNSIRPMLKLSLVALMAAMGGLFTAGGASACEMATKTDCAIATTCGCCEAPARAEPEPPGLSTNESRTAPLRSFTTCESRPSGICVCDAGRPTAPDPRTGREGSDTRDATARDTGLVPSRLLPPSPASMARSALPTAGPPRRTPLYLRTSRLLI